MSTPGTKKTNRKGDGVLEKLQRDTVGARCSRGGLAALAASAVLVLELELALFFIDIE